MRRHTHTTAALMLAVALTTLGLTAACSKPEDGLGKSISLLETTLLYRDMDGLWKLHVASVGQDPLCSPQGQELFARAAKETNPTACKQASAVLATPQSKELDSEALMLLDLIDFHCTHPNAPCTDFARRRFEQQTKTSRLWARPIKALGVHRTQVDGDTATTYVEITYEDDQSTDRATLRWRRHGQRWLLTSYP